MTKEQKSAEELAEMISARFKMRAVIVRVHKDAVDGWQPTVMTSPAHAVDAQIVAEEIAKELRLSDDLKSGGDATVIDFRR